MPNRRYTDHLACSQKVKNLIMNECIAEFRRLHPEFKKVEITQGFILEKVAFHYIGRDWDYEI